MKKERPDRIQRMLEMGSLREQTMSKDQVVALWRKAVEAAADAEIPQISIDGALRSAYDAGHLATLALLAAYGLKTGSGQGHQEAAVAGAARGQ